MSNNKMLIDATHPEETRVVVLRGGRVEEFDFESAARKLLRGNIYLAKVTRVEPSLQAAFVEYGGNRHGFLAFNEIHPDYYQIPMADRQALIEEEAAAEAAEEAAVDARAEAMARRRGRAHPKNADSQDNGEENDEDHFDHSDEEEPVEVGAAPGEQHEETEEFDEGEAPHHRTLAAASLPQDDRITESADNEDENLAANENVLDAASSSEEPARPEEAKSDSENGQAHVQAQDGPHDGESNGSSVEAERVEQVGSGEDALEELPSRPRRRPRSYKIQEVIKRRQVILVQVVKEERGNKGAALTTYLSLAGRYTVLMPNTARGGGISRKITNPQDRKRLKAIATDLEVPEGMGLIIRTAGAARTKQEIKRDFEYLLRLWESVRDLTLRSQAPSLVYEEGNLIKRSIRDLYNKDVEEVIVAGPEAYKEAKDFMRMLMPSHAKNVNLYQEPEPLFTRQKIESQLNAMFSPYVTLRSGGYLVINQTEALVAVDVNSGKSTREFSIEETALNTNLEASDEIARQLKLRDLAGLIVVDFIDMEEKRNNRAVERRLKDALRHDRARIQVGRISHFGLLEMSRQRLRTGVLEGSTSQCAHCQGTGIIRSTESVALAVLRGLEDAITAGGRTPLVATTTPSVALYILNNKRPFINDMEARHGLPITVTGSDKLAGANFTIEKGAAPAQPQRRVERMAVNMDWGFDEADEGGDGGEVLEAPEPRQAPRDAEAAAEGQADGRRRRRRRRRGGRRGDRPEGEGYAENGRDASDLEMSEDGVALSGGSDDDDDSGAEFNDAAREESRAGGEERAGQRSRRRGRRGGRRGRERRAGGPEGTSGAGEQPEIGTFAPEGSPETEASFSPEPTQETAREPSPPSERNERPARRTRAPAPAPTPAYAGEDAYAGNNAEVLAEPAAPAPAAEAEAVAPKRARHRAGASEPRIERIVVSETGQGAPAADAAPEEGAAPARKGWWQRRLGGE
ncbi:MAG TPA: ribonuclease E/G [Hyphomicrobium sp.]